MTNTATATVLEYRPRPAYKNLRRPHRGDKINPAFADMLRSARDELGATRADVASAAGVTPATVAYHESGKATYLPRPSLFYKLVDGYQLTGQEIEMFSVAYGAVQHDHRALQG